MLLVTFAISIFAIVQKNHVTGGLIFLNWTLIADSIATLVIGTMLWFFSLEQRNNYHIRYQALPNATRVQIQDKVGRCLPSSILLYLSPADELRSNYITVPVLRLLP